MAAVVVHDAVVVLLGQRRERVKRLITRISDAVRASSVVGPGTLVDGVREAVVVVVRIGAAIAVLVGVVVLCEAGTGVRAGAGEVHGEREVGPRVADAVLVVVYIGAAVSVRKAVEVLRQRATEDIVRVKDAVVIVIVVTRITQAVGVTVDLAGVGFVRAIVVVVWNPVVIGVSQVEVEDQGAGVSRRSSCLEEGGGGCW